MTRYLCDRCEADLTEANTWGAVTGIEEADRDGNGTVTDEVILCRRCYGQLRQFLEVLPREAPPHG